MSDGGERVPTLLRRLWLWQHFKRHPDHVAGGRYGIILTCATCLGASAPERGYYGPALGDIMALRRWTKPARQPSWLSTWLNFGGRSGRNR